MKKFLLVCICIIIVLLLLDFIPVKFAKKLDDVSYVDGTYVCEYTTATDGNWMATVENNPHLEETVFLNLETDGSFYNQKEIANLWFGTAIFNQYIFYGNVEERKITEKVYFKWINLDKWDIVYPIRRQSFRALYAPKSYLTVYDFNWTEVIKNTFK